MLEKKPRVIAEGRDRERLGPQRHVRCRRNGSAGVGRDRRCERVDRRTCVTERLVVDGAVGLLCARNLAARGIEVGDEKRVREVTRRKTPEERFRKPAGLRVAGATKFGRRGDEACELGSVAIDEACEFAHCGGGEGAIRELRGLDPGGEDRRSLLRVAVLEGSEFAREARGPVGREFDEYERTQRRARTRTDEEFLPVRSEGRTGLRDLPPGELDQRARRIRL